MGQQGASKPLVEADFSYPPSQKAWDLPGWPLYFNEDMSGAASKGKNTDPGKYRDRVQ